MDPESRGLLDPHRWSTNKRVKARTGEYLGAPVLTAPSSKRVRPGDGSVPAAMRVPATETMVQERDRKRREAETARGQALLNGLLTLQSNKEATILKLRRRGYSTQSEHEFIKLRWPANKPMV